MKTFKHEPNFRYAMDHKAGCKGDNGRCPRCGRLMCTHCTTRDGSQYREHLPGHAGECIICSGMYTEETIVLNPAAWYWDNGVKVLLDENI